MLFWIYCIIWMMTKEICTYVVIIIEKDWSVDACYAQRTQRRSQIYALRHRLIAFLPSAS